MWFKGPVFLYQASRDIIEEYLLLENESELLEEVGHLHSQTCLTIDKELIDNVIDISRYNDLLKLYRVTAFVMRCIYNIKLRLKGKEINTHTRY